MRLYVAGHTKDPRVPVIQDRLDREGHAVFSWQALESEPGITKAGIAHAELNEIAECDAVVVVWHPRLLGALVEAGAAIAAGKPVLLLDLEPLGAGDIALRPSIFWSLPNVYSSTSIESAVRVLRGLQTRIEQQVDQLGDV